MTILRQTLAATLAAALCAPASAAQTYQGRLNGARTSAVPQVTLGALGARLVVGTPGLVGAPGLSLIPTLAAPALSAPLVAPGLAAAPAAAPASQATPSMKVSAVSEAVAPAIQALQAPGLKGEGAAAAAESMMAPVVGKAAQGADSPVAAPEQTAPKAAGVKLRGSPVLTKVSYAPEVSAEHQQILAESLTRRKAGWTRGLATMGVKLEGPAAPAVTVKAAKDVAKGTKVEYTIEWNQGETRVGAFKAFVARKDAQPELRRGMAPEPAKEKQIRVRFKKDAAAADIEVFLESRGLRLLSKGWGDGYTRVSVTGQDQADAVANALSGKGLVLYATPETFTVPEANQVQIVFKKSAVRSFGGVNAETSVGEAEIGEFLSAHGLRVLSIDRDGVYTVGAEGLVPQVSAQFLQGQPAVLYAKPLKFDPPAASQLIISLRDKSVSEDDVNSLLRRHGLMLVKVLNNGAYKVARVSDGTTGADLAAAVSAEPIVKAAIALGGVTDAQIQSAARGVASYKGRPWSSTEYNMNYGMTYWYLEEQGATPEQLKEFERLCDEAPMRGGGFNPWSGD